MALPNHSSPNVDYTNPDNWNLKSTPAEIDKWLAKQSERFQNAMRKFGEQAMDEYYVAGLFDQVKDYVERGVISTARAAQYTSYTRLLEDCVVVDRVLKPWRNEIKRLKTSKDQLESKVERLEARYEEQSELLADYAAESQRLIAIIGQLQSAQQMGQQQMGQQQMGQQQMGQQQMGQQQMGQQQMGQPPVVQQPMQQQPPAPQNWLQKWMEYSRAFALASQDAQIARSQADMGGLQRENNELLKASIRAQYEASGQPMPIMVQHATSPKW